MASTALMESMQWIGRQPLVQAETDYRKEATKALVFELARAMDDSKQKKEDAANFDKAYPQFAGPPPNQPPLDTGAPTPSMKAQFGPPAGPPPMSFMPPQPGPQAPMPGAPSMPMQGQGPVPASPQQPMPPPPGAPTGGAPPPGPAGAAPMPQGGPGMAPGGPPPGAGGAGAMPPPAPPQQGYTPIPGGQFAPGKPPPQQQAMDRLVGVMQKQVLDPSKLLDDMVKQGARPSDALRHIKQLEPLIKEHNEMIFKEKEIEIRAQDAAKKAATEVRMEGHMKAQEAYWASEAASKSAARTAGAETRKQLADWKTKHGAKGGGGGVPLQPDPAKAKDDDALDIAAWSYIKTGQYPSRKGKFDAGDYNRKVIERVATIAKDMGMSPQELTAERAEFKADAQSLAFQTKKVDAIASTLASFHNNIDTWNSIAQGEAPKLGGERVAAAAKMFEKINFIGVQKFDDIKLAIQKQTNDPTVAAYMTSAMAVAMDFARIMQGPQSVASLTEGAREDAQRLIAAGADDKARAGILAALESDAAGQVKGLEDQLTVIRKRMGKTPDTGKKDSPLPKSGKLTPEEEKELATLKAKYGK